LLVFADVLYRSVDGGASFAPVLNAFVDDVEFDPLDGSIVYVAATANGLFRSLDFGATFAPFGHLGTDQVGAWGAHVISVQATRHQRTFYLNGGRGNFRSDDGGETFKPINRGYRAALVQDVVFDAGGRPLVAGLHTAGIFRAIRPGEYELVGATLPGFASLQVDAVATSPADPGVYVAMTLEGICRTTDSGASWTISTGLFVGSPARITFAPSDASSGARCSRLQDGFLENKTRSLTSPTGCLWC
jgi:hypothetical protein